MSFEKPISENLHEKNRIQDIPFNVIQKFTERVQKITGGKAEKPTPEREEEINQMIDEVASIFDKANIEYTIDGALNISLYENSFLRDHRDIDVSVFSKDIPKLARVLEKNGYALFRFPKNSDGFIKKGVVRHELLDTEKIDVKTISREHPLFLRVNKDLKIDVDNYSWFDIHALDTNENGDVIMPNGTIIPKEKYKKRKTYTTKSGKELRLSHPAILAYHKLLSGRDHPDFDDLVALKEHLSESDFSDIENWLQQDENSGWDECKPKVKKAWGWLEKLKNN